MRIDVRAVCAAAIGALAITGAAAADLSNGALAPGDALAATQAATAGFHSLAAAENAGYTLLEDKNGIACITDTMSPSPMGAMGVHYASNRLVADGRLASERPEALVYAPSDDGRRLRLAAVEYVVLQEAWAARHAGPPVLFGHRLALTRAGNRFGLPAYYSLHVWLFQPNPKGEFAMWNPRVHCPG
jgi:hypothetical protein